MLKCKALTGLVVKRLTTCGGYFVIVFVFRHLLCNTFGALTWLGTQPVKIPVLAIPRTLPRPPQT